MTVPSDTPQEAISSPGPFEGPEKLLEIWFAPSYDQLPSPTPQPNSYTPVTARPSEARRQTINGQKAPVGALKGLRQVPKEVWEEMLDIVKCKVLSVVEGDELDAYLLSESSLFVAPHLIILKTCGTTLNLLGLYRIIEIAKEWCGYTNVWRCFYSRKSFFFPERQQGPHKDWTDEVRFLDTVFGTAGAAYTVGPMNRDHWLLYLTSPNTVPHLPTSSLPSPASSLILPSPQPQEPLSHLASASNAIASSSTSFQPTKYQDTTLEILMTHLSPSARSKFYNDEIVNGTVKSGLELGAEISKELGIDQLFSREETVLDSFGFDPCGYSANAVIASGLPEASSSSSSSGSGNKKTRGGGYFTIHVTPEEGWSYASFECNVPLPTSTSTSTSTSRSTSTSTQEEAIKRPELQDLIRKVVNIFEPSRLSITLFVSTPAATATSAASGPHDIGNGDAETQQTEVEQRAWQSFGTDLLGKSFVRKDRIGYEFDGYDLVFACFEKRGWKEPVSKGQMSIGEHNGDV
ncbi:S-adenosylmethionine decarboxylase proenzyme [Kwoniella dejecticola CBS 10117]|uniref:S-adenosylmethionine decarboxylase proenzyme n=1 Tax=Kwoniella dejecticola CBS 10117 TaxID=1296121 RepID=A0A1A6A5Y4_9TREE|nr:S-adenosylmethionine decarboxylase proenzyme [Kwoniella dejecticola CBS 10117]OBR85466.1 S-adenosylmethionine decarboxylase proenzyme [Kwoniella dejecticola CBS 10117]